MTSMKKVLLVFFFSLCSFNFSEAQTSVYHPFPDSGAVWNVHWQCMFGYGDGWFSYTFDGDTIINSTTYHKIIKPFVITTGGCGTGGLIYQGCIRQDTAFREVYMIQPYDSVERVLFDFAIQIGDTLPMDSQVCMSAAIVQMMDSILIDNNYRKRWSISTGSQLIEGIGTTNGLLEPLCVILDFPLTTLTCFSQNGQTLYPDTITNCNIIDGVKESAIKTSPSEISISPNPFHTTATITASWQTAVGNAQLSIYNCMGALVREQIINQESAIINRNGLADGLYFFQLTTNSGPLATGKFVIK